MIDFYSLLVVTVVSLLTSLVLTPLTRDAFLNLGILDRPDGGRKLHRRPIPRVGGVPITFSYLVAFGALLAMRGGGSLFVQQQLPFVVKLLPAIGVVFVTGLLDDVFELRPWQKLVGQLAGAGLAVAGGVRILGLSGHPLFPWLGTALTVVWLIGCANAFNLIDGLDGLAAGMGLLATLTTFVAALLHGNHALVLATLPLAGALLGFLRYNFNPASVFLGDSGSLLLGFLLGCYGVIWSQKSATLLGMMAPVMALAIPLLDTGLAIVRRWLRGSPIFRGDRNHIHHKLLERGLTHRRVVLTLYAVCTVYAALSLLESTTENRFGGVAVVLFCGITWVGVRTLGYFEFGVAGKAVFGGALRKVVHAHIAIHSFQRLFTDADSVDAYWKALSGLAKDLGFSGVDACLHGYPFGKPALFPEQHRYWQVRIPLAGGDYVVLSRDLNAPPIHGMVMPLIEAVMQSRNHLEGLPRLEPRPAPPVSISSLLGLTAGIGPVAAAEEHLPSP